MTSGSGEPKWGERGYPPPTWGTAEAEYRKKARNEAAGSVIAVVLVCSIWIALLVPLSAWLVRLALK